MKRLGRFINITRVFKAAPFFGLMNTQKPTLCAEDMDLGMCNMNTEDCSCWSCDKPVEHLDFFCSFCDKIQGDCLLSDFYDLFELPERTFMIDQDHLHNKYREIQKTIHPDGFMKKGDEALKFATRMSARLNDAYNTLSMSNLRATYLLELDGHSIDNVMLDGEFLSMMVKDTNRIEEDDSLTDPDIQEIVKTYEELLAQEENEFDKYYSIGDVENSLISSSKMNYIQRVMDIGNNFV